LLPAAFAALVVARPVMWSDSPADTDER
jgi:hypothetical protein